MNFIESILRPWYRFGHSFEHQVEIVFEEHGRNVAKYPARFIGGVFLIVALCGIGFANFRVVSEGEKLWVPQDSEAKMDEKFIEDNFGASYRGGSALFVSTRAMNNDILNLEAFEDIWNVHEKAIDVSTGGRTFEDLCAIRDDNDECFTFGVVQFFSGNRTYYNSVVQSRDDLINFISSREFPNGAEVNRAQIFGDYEVDESTDLLISCKGTIQYYQIDGENENRALKWEEKFVDAMDGTDSGSIELYFFANRSFDDELARSVGGDIILFVITYILMISFTCIVLAKKYNAVEMRNGLSLCGIVIVILAMFTAYGLCSGLGSPFNTLHQVLPFIVVGVGVDDMFIIVATFDAQDENLETSERLARAFKRCGMSITYTTVTDVVAFYLGATSSLPAIEAFCYYAGTSILFNFLFQITAFSALLVLDAERIKHNKWDFLFCFTSSRASSLKTVGSVEGEDKTGKEEEGYHQVQIEESNEPMKVVKPIDDNGNEKKPLTLLQHFFSEIYFPFISIPTVRVVVVLGFLGLLGACIYGCTRVTQGFDVIDLVPDDSYVRDYVENARDLDLFIFEQNTPTELVYKDIPYHQQDTQEEMIRLETEFIELPHNAGPVTSWISEFISWARTDDSPYKDDLNADGYLTDEALFYEAVNLFLTLPDYSRFDQDVVFETEANMNGIQTIKTSRVQAYQIDMTEPKEQIEGMEDARDFMDRTFLDPKPFCWSSAFSNIETEQIIVDEMVLNLSVALVGVFFVSLFVLVRPSAVILVCILVAMVDVDIIGTMFFWNLQINTVTVVQLVMAVGLVVDYIAHILHYYLTQSWSKSPEERLRDGLVEIGPSVLLGCSTTFLGVIPLAFSSSVIFRTFFRMFFCIIVYGAAHGLILLPAILPSLPFTDISEVSAVATSEKQVEMVKSGDGGSTGEGGIDKVNKEVAVIDSDEGNI